MYAYDENMDERLNLIERRSVSARQMARSKYISRVSVNTKMDVFTSGYYVKHVQICRCDCR